MPYITVNDQDLRTCDQDLETKTRNELATRTNAALASQQVFVSSPLQAVLAHAVDAAFDFDAWVFGHV